MPTTLMLAAAPKGAARFVPCGCRPFMWRQRLLRRLFPLEKPKRFERLLRCDSAFSDRHRYLEPDRLRFERALTRAEQTTEIPPERHREIDADHDHEQTKHGSKTVNEYIKHVNVPPSCDGSRGPVGSFVLDRRQCPRSLGSGPQGP